jgi:hypothetical protein
MKSTISVKKFLSVLTARLSVHRMNCEDECEIVYFCLGRGAIEMTDDTPQSTILLLHT